MRCCCWGTFGYQRAGSCSGYMIYHIWYIDIYDISYDIYNIWYILYRPPYIWSGLWNKRRLRKTIVIAFGRNVSWVFVGVIFWWMSISFDISRQSNQGRNFVLFILVSLFFSLRDYVGNARNAGMLLRLSLPSNKRIPNTLFSLTYDSGL